MHNSPTLVRDYDIAGLVRLIGMEAYLALVREYGGTTLYIPTAQSSANILEQWLTRGGMPYGAAHEQATRP
jgi:hypothetical protein